jgi:stage III sporulation protein SpoIIIAA
LSIGRIAKAIEDCVYVSKKSTVDRRPPQIYVIGPPLSGKTTVAKEIAKK